MCASVAAELLIWLPTWLAEVVAHMVLRLQAQEHVFKAVVEVFKVA